MVEVLDVKEDLLERLKNEYYVEKKHLHIHLVNNSNFEKIGISKNDYIILDEDEHNTTTGISKLEKHCEKKYISVSILSKAMNIRIIEIYKLIKADIIPAIAIGHRILIPSSWYEEF